MRDVIAMVAIATFVAVAAGCDQTKNCCFSGTLVVEVDPASNFVIIKGATRGLGCAYDQDIIECDLQQDGSCYNPFHVVVFGLNYVMITKATDNQSQTIANSTNPQADITVAGFYAIIQEGEGSGYQYYDGAMYRFGSDMVTQSAALAICKEEGGNLASIHSKAENEFVFSLNPSPAATRWIGAIRDRSAGTAANFVFTWTDGSSWSPLVEMQNPECRAGGGCEVSAGGCCIWKKNEPNDRNPSFTPENCVSQGHKKVVANPAGWDDSDCNELKHYVCKRPVTCLDTIVDENADSSSKCQDKASVGRICRSECDTGYLGGPGEYTCTANGLYQLQSGDNVCTPKDCGDVITTLPKNGVANCSAHSSFFDTEATATCIAGCDAGFDIIGDSQYACGSDGRWQGQYSCKAKDCGDSIVTLSSHVSADCSKGNTAFGGDACTASCNNGFTPATGDGVYTCSTDGKWEGELTCVPVSCDPRGPPFAWADADTGIAVIGGLCGGQTFFGGDKCTTECTTGYQPIVEVGLSPIFTCNADGVWEGNFGCQKVDCGDLKPSDNIVVQSCEGNLYQDTCQTACLAGFQPDPAWNGVGVYTCAADGRWVGSEIPCVRKRCGPLSDIAPVSARPVKAPCDSLFESVCKLECVDGFELQFGAASYTCNSNGLWDGAIFCGRITCQPLNLDFVLGSGANVELSSPCSNKLFQDTCDAQCIPGYEPATGSPTFTCSAAGTWIGEYSCEKKDCGASIPYDTLGEFAVASCSATLFGSTCKAACELGYEPVSFPGDAVAAMFTCTADGEWSGYSNCQPVNCGSTVPSVGVHVTGTCFGNTRYRGTPCQLNCAAGYHLAATDDFANGLYQCSNLGVWVGNTVCEPNQCSEIVDGLEIDMTTAVIAPCPPGSNLFGGPSCRAFCRPGFQPVSGDGVISCNADQTWSGQLECGRIDCDPLDGLDPNAVTTCSQLEFEATCLAKCKPGYEPTSGTGVYTCGADKKFTGSLVCSPVECGSRIAELDANAFARCVGDTRFGGDRCLAVCDEGYIGGDAYFTCGTDGNWQGSLKCVRKDCGALVPESTQGNLRRSNCRQSLFEDTCDVFCQPGFNLLVFFGVGAPPSTAIPAAVGSGDENSSGSNPIGFEPALSATFSCGADAFWSGPQTQCIPKDCGPLMTGHAALPANSAASCSTDTAFGGEACTVACSANYKRVAGSFDFTCSSDGSWTGFLDCAPVDCGAKVIGAREQNTISACDPAKTTFGETCDVSCRPGTETGTGIDSTLYTCSGATGLWDGVLICSPKHCDDTLPIGVPVAGVAGPHYKNDTTSYSNGICTGDNRFEGDNCIVECAAGYTLTNGNGVFICGDDGQWSGKATCSPRNCGAMLPDAANTVYSCASTVFEGPDCVARCRMGYEAVISENSYRCTADGSWMAADKEFRCQPVQCPAAPNLSPNVVADCGAIAEFEAVSCMASCAPGYEPSLGDGVYSCGADGRWSGELECKPVNCGGEITTVDPASVAHRVCLNSDFRGFCIAYCRPGYTAVKGSPFFTCGTEAAWVGEFICEKNICPSLPTKAPQNVGGRCTGISGAGATCRLTCAPGFSQIGKGEYTCSDSGVWVGGCGFDCVDASEWTTFNGNLYQLDLEPRMFSDAEALCQSKGAQPASVHDQAENNFVFGLQSGLNLDAPVGVWLGAQLIRTSTPQTKPFDFKWVDGSPFNTFLPSPWAKNEPNDFRGEENCLSIGFNDARRTAPNLWNDIHCDDTFATVCMRPMEATCSMSETSMGGFYVALTSYGLGDPNGQRFSTALDPAFTINRIEYQNQATGQKIGGVTEACKDECQDEETCVGFFLQQAGANLVCHLLSNLGNAIPTSSTGTSFAQIGYDWDPVPATTQAPPASTTTEALSTTTTTTTAAVDTTRLITTSSKVAAFGMELTYNGASSTSVAGTRFGAAYTAEQRTDLFFDDTTPQEAHQPPPTCLEACSVQPWCKGVYWRITPRNRGQCRLLGELGAAVSTKDVGSSWSKVV